MTKQEHIVYVPGTWDLFHSGHVNLLRRAWGLGDWVIAGVNTDESVLKYKGARPFIPLTYRIDVVRACRYVDAVEKREFPLNIDYFKSIGVSTLVLGSDWKNKSLEGLDEAKKQLEVVYFPYTEEISSSTIKDWIRNEAYRRL